MMQIDVANNWIQLVLASLIILSMFVGLIVWAIRVESKVGNLENEITKSNEEKIRMWNQMSSIQETMNQMLQAIGRLDGKLDVLNK